MIISLEAFQDALVSLVKMSHAKKYAFSNCTPMNTIVATVDSPI